MTFLSSPLTLFLLLALVACASSELSPNDTRKTIAPDEGGLGGLGGSIRPAPVEQQMCDLPFNDEAIVALNDFSEAGNECASTIGLIKLLVDLAKEYYTQRKEVSSKSESIKTAIDQASDSIKAFRPALRTMGTLGTAILAIENSLLSASEKVFDFLAGDEDVTTRKVGNLDEISQQLERLRERVENSTKAADVTVDFLEGVRSLSEATRCCGENQLDLIAENGLSTSLLNNATALYETCSFIELPDSPMLEFTPPDLSTLTKIDVVVGNMSSWVDTVMGDFLGSADMFECCTFVGDVTDFFSDLSGLLMCPVNGAINGVVSESLDVLLPVIENPLVSTYNAIGVKIDSVMDAVESVMNTFEGSDMPSIKTFGLFDNLVALRCTMDMGPYENGALISIDPVEPQSVERFEPLRFEADGTFDLAAIGDAIVEECSAAVDAFSENAECCSAATIEHWGAMRENSDSCDYHPNCIGDMKCVFVDLEIGKVCTNGNIGSWCDGNGACDSGICVASGIKQGSKCSSGSNGGDCTLHSQCNSNVCLSSICQSKNNGAQCGLNSQCFSGHCVAGTCQSGSHRSPCTLHSHCNSNVCLSSICQSKNNGAQCRLNSQCFSGHCVAGTCQSGSYGSPCNLSEHCDSGYYCNRGACYDGRPGSRCSIHRDCVSNNCPWRTKVCR